MSRCPEPCGKVRFVQQHMVHLAAIRQTMNGLFMKPYWSESCRIWHLTHANSGRVAHRLSVFLPDTPAAGS